MNRKLLFISIALRIAFLLIILLIIFEAILVLDPPEIDDYSCVKLKRNEINDSTFSIGENWFQKNRYGLYEMKASGAPFELGVISGKLSAELVKSQEDAFINQMKKLIPDEGYLKFLKYFIAFFNRDIDEYVPGEYLQEIYGMSFSASYDYDYIASKYQRILNYHGAHDIGHALQDLHLVGCTSFGVWDDKSKDSSIIIGRNFDLYLGDDFAHEKIVSFVKPENGYGFMSVSWGGMVGAVSGMNEKGLTVTINAAKSIIPTSARMPVSLLVREILQYASNIDEAYKIAEKRKLFVSESFLIGSDADHNVVIIEKTPDETAIYDPDGSQIICSNHYQSDYFKNDSLNLLNIRESSTKPRYMRLTELIQEKDALEVDDVAEILRNRKGIHDENIGMGNENLINQMIGHHSIIFKPSERKVWVSTSPFQLGCYVCYDLEAILNTEEVPAGKEVFVDSLTIPEDPFIHTNEFRNYQKYRIIKEELWLYDNGFSEIDPGAAKATEIIELNPDYFLSYVLAGDYFFNKEMFMEAKEYYSLALEREVATIPEEEYIRTRILNCTSD